MKPLLLAVLISATIFSCTEKSEKTAGAENKNTRDTTYQAAYPGNFSQDVSDADVHAVMLSYKEWENGNMDKVVGLYADSIMWERNNGEKKVWSKPDLLKYWGAYRDSLSSVVVKMDAWDRAYDSVKKEAYVITWYREYDTYKDGRVDSADYHDVNGVKDGKIAYFSQYRRALK